jgi:hypothetical protein
MEWNFLVELLYGFFFFFFCLVWFWVLGIFWLNCFMDFFVVVSLLSFWVLANGCDLVFEDFHV